MNKGLIEVARALKRHKSFLITSHINPEGDSIGSQLATAFLLKRLGKSCIIFNNDPAPRLFQFMLGGEMIRTHIIKREAFEAVIAVDCPVVERSGRAARYLKSGRVVINIDHHVSNSRFGDAVWIEPAISSCGEMLYYLYKRLNVPIDAKAALAMYVAILTDTGYFSYENTTYKTHKIIGELLRYGISPLWVGTRLNEKKTPNELRLLSETLNTLQLHHNSRVATLHTSAFMLKRLNLDPQSAEGFVNYARSVDTVKVAAFFLERPDKPGEVHVSFRSKGEVDVNTVARIFDGGGHPNASGCVIKGSIAQAKKIVLEKVTPFLSNSKPGS